jgi:metallo-beta-lactamase family protein
MVSISFYGAAGEVTGSAHLITLWDGFKILLDCGLFQGDEQESSSLNRKWHFDPERIDCVVLSHAHIDHCGRLPKLVRDGFSGNIYCTPATRNLALVMLLDSAKIQQADAEFEMKWFKKKGKKQHIQEPLYDTQDVYRTVSQMVSIDYERRYRLHPNVELILRDAGHILGSASVNLAIKLPDGSIKTLGFTGDIGRPDRPILRDPAPMIPAEILITESTYGAKLHESKASEYDKLLHIIEDTCVKNEGKLLIPAFSLGRTQEIVYMLNKMHFEDQLPDIPVYVDSPLSVNATRIFRMHPECYDENAREFVSFDNDPFGFNGLTYITDVELSKGLNHRKGPCIIISSSGMASAGRIRHHIFNNIEQKRNTILIAGYCSPGTLGHILKQKIDELTLFGEKLQVRARIETMDSFSAHGDREEMLQFLSNHKTVADQVFLVHGNSENREQFKILLDENGFKGVIIPKFGQSFDLFND